MSSWVAYALTASPYVEVFDNTLTSKSVASLTTGATAVAISPDNHWLAVSQTTSVFIYDLTSGTPVKVTGITDVFTTVVTLKFSPDSTQLLVIDNGAADRAYVYAVSTWAKTHTATPGFVVQNGAWSSDGLKLALGYNGGSFFGVYTIAANSFASPTSLPGAVPRGIDWSPDGKYIALLDATGAFFVYRTDTMAKLADPTTLPGSTTALQNVVKFSPDSTRLAVAITASPFMCLYSLATANTVTYLAAPATLPDGAGRGVSWAGDSGEFVLAQGAGPNRVSTFSSAGVRKTDYTPVVAAQLFDVASTLPTFASTPTLTIVSPLNNDNPSTANRSSFTLGYNPGVAGTAAVAVIASSGGVSSISSPSGLVFTRRSISTQTFTGVVRKLEVWWAPCAAVVNEIWTVNLVSSDVAWGTSFGVHGLSSIYAPWDATAPTTGDSGTSASTGATPSSTVSTTSSAGMLFTFAFGGCAGISEPNAPVLGTGWTDITFRDNRSTFVATIGQKLYSSKLTSAIENQGYSDPSMLWTFDAMPGAVTVTETGTITTNLTKPSQSAAGTITPKESGTITTRLTKLSMSAVGVQKFSGAITTHLTKPSQSAAGAVANNVATIHTALSRASLALVAAEVFKGSVTTNLSRASLSMAGWVTTTFGTITTSLAKPSQSLMGAQANNAGPIVTRLGRVAQSASGTVNVTGHIVTNIDQGVGIRIVARAVEVFTGTITTHLSPGIAQQALAQEIEQGAIITRLPGGLVQSLAGEVYLDAKITTRLGDANVLVTTVIHASQIIKGPIVTTLYGFHVPAVGGLMGAAGAGDWYSWRNTDS